MFPFIFSPSIVLVLDGLWLVIVSEPSTRTQTSSPSSPPSSSPRPRHPRHALIPLPKDLFSEPIPLTVIDTSFMPERTIELITECPTVDTVMLTYACDRTRTLEWLSSF